MLRRLVLRSLVAALALAVGAELFIQANRGDAPAPDDADLASSRVPVPDERNGFVRLRDAAGGLVWSDEAATRLSEARKTGQWDNAAARSLIEPNDAAFHALRAALEAPEFQDPEERNVRDASVEPVLELKRFGRLAATRAVERARAGDADGALADALDSIELGLRFQADPGSAMLEGSLGCGLQGIGLDAIAAALPHLALRASDSLRWSRELSGLRPTAEAWRSLWAADYRRTKESFAWGERLHAAGETSMDRSPWVSALLPEGYLFKTNATLELFASATREARQRADRPCRPAPPTEWHSRGPLGQILLLIGPNGFGHVLLAIAWPNFAHADLRRCGIEVRIAATQALLGLRAHSTEQGRLPDSLDELVPRYLDELPADPFDGAPLRYRPEEKLVYSIGANLRDERGAKQEDEKDLLEPTYPIAF